ncbi:type IV secretory system conjugative DNA transfer family protein, partial [Patescibacteria group bacterium]
MNPDDQITIVGEANFRNQLRRFGIKQDDRRRHMYLIGKTGMGKSVLLQNLAISDIHAGHGLCFIDPHGDAAEELLNFIPPHRVNDVIYFNPSDLDFPLAFNILETVDPKYKHLVASGLVAVFKKMWADSWGPRLEYILRNTIFALLDFPSSTLLGVPRLLTDKQYRRKVVAKVTDPVIKAFWVEEFENYNDRFMVEAISPIQNKVGQFLSAAVVRNIIGQPKSSISLEDAMNNHKIII